MLLTVKKLAVLRVNMHITEHCFDVNVKDMRRTSVGKQANLDPLIRFCFSKVVHVNRLNLPFIYVNSDHMNMPKVIAVFKKNYQLIRADIGSIQYQC